MSARHSRWRLGVGRRTTLANAERRVLVLQGDLALWTHWQGGQRVAERVERLDTDPSAATVCPWPSAGETFVDVVADSPLDEIERVLASGGEVPDAARDGVVARLRRRLLGLRLARHHPEARVRTAPAAAAPLLAALLQAELPEDWRRRLEALQREAVTVRVLHSAIRLREATGNERRGDVLSVTRGGGVERHLLYRHGCPTFTRVVRAGDARASRAALDETLAHLAARHGVLAARTEGARAAPPATPPDDGCDVEDAHRLAALAAHRRPRSGAAPSAVLDKHRRHAELRRLHVFTALTASIALLTVLASAVHGIDSARRRAAASAAGAVLVERVERLATTLATRHDAPELADASLALVERHAAARAPDAADVLGLLAGVLSAHPDVGLDRLAWSTPEPQDEPGTVRLGSAADLPARAVPASEAGASGAWLELAGRIEATGESPLRGRQRRFETFVAALERTAGITDVDVRLSPASAAATRGGEMEGGWRIDYELRLRYARPK